MTTGREIIWFSSYAPNGKMYQLWKRPDGYIVRRIRGNRHETVRTFVSDKAAMSYWNRLIETGRESPY
jgi:hypothetical protein